MMECFFKNSKPFTIFKAMLHYRLLTEFQIHIRYISKSLFRTQLNIYGGVVLQKQLMAKSCYFSKNAPSQTCFGFLNTSLGNTGKKIEFKRHFLNHVKYFVSLFLSCIFYLVEQIKKTLEKKIENLTFEVSDPSTHFLKKLFPIRDQTFMTSTWREGERS